MGHEEAAYAVDVLHTCSEPWRMEILRGNELPSVLAALGDFERAYGQLSLNQKPDWLLCHHENELEHLGVFILYGCDTICGFAPFLLQRFPLTCYAGEFRLIQFNIQCVRFLGPPRFPEENSAYDLLFAKFQKMTDVDGLFVEALPIESFLFKYVERSPIAAQFLRHGRSRNVEHFVIALPSSYEEYARKFSSKTRNTLSRRFKKLKAAGLGEPKLQRITEEKDIDEFVDRAVAVSKKTYQWHLLGLGLREAEKLKRELKFLARHGWARCYLLSCGNTPIAFTLCYQDHDTCYYIDVGFDRDWRDFSAGTVLQVMVLQDLFEFRTPRYFDLGGMAEHKKFFGNTSYMESNVLLLRRRPYPVFASLLTRTVSGVSDKAVSFLDQIGLKRRIKKWIRTTSVTRKSDDSREKE